MAHNVYGFETDTVWGLGCDVEDKEGVEKIYEIKGRDKNKPLILMSYDVSCLLKYIENVDDKIVAVMKKYWPGAITFIFNKSEKCPDFISKTTIALRIPNHPLFKNVCNETPNKVLATTSLNFSGDKPCEDYDEAIKKFGSVCKIFKPQENFQKQNVPSTIVDFSKGSFEIIRQGCVKFYF
ncbi:MAG: threonylcarbamoyl-AMP synthase [Cyanobacteria bacterium SIG30]|nr:threonylcarbamoyl-AMP synthase [Cyanobacteria bacterium SIG30]